jgi:hypothetical protein
MNHLQEKNRCVVTQRFYTAYRTQWGPHASTALSTGLVGGAQARPERLFK